LYEQIAAADRALFGAYNKGDLAGIEGSFTKDLEFYHDKSGLSNYQQTIDALNRGFVGATKVRRELVPGTLEVYPLQGFGAVEIGIHRFFSTAPGQKERLTATAKFVHVWKKTHSGWQLARVVSYDHR
jgi:ketosteroid isomerase-like protein